MMNHTIYNNNRIVLEKYHPELAEQIKPYMEGTRTISDEGVVAGVEQVADKTVLFAQKGEQVFQLDSLYDTRALLDAWDERLGAIFNSQYLCFGFGNGMFVRKLLASHGEAIRVFVYEPSLSIFMQAMASFDISDILKDARFSIMFAAFESPSDNLFYALASRISYEGFAGLRIADYINYDQLFPEKLSYFIEKKENVCDSVRSNRVVNERFGRKFVENTFLNAPYFMHSYNLRSLQPYLPEELPVIIVSSGPSLNANIEQLKRAKGKAIIISADSAVSVLLKKDIIPDFYMCVDPKKHEKHFSDERVKDIPVMCNMTTTIAALRGHRAQVFYTKAEDAYIDTFLANHGIELMEVSSGGSVANAIYSAVMALGLRKVILVGQDLAYTGNKSHAEGSLRASWNMDLSINAVEIEGLHGEMVASSSEFVLYRNWFERMIAQYPQMQTINATEGGARIHGAMEMTLSDAIDTWCQREYDITGIIACARPLMNREVREAFYQYMKEVPTSFAAMDDKLRSGMNMYAEMLKMVDARKYQNARFQKLYDTVSQTNAYLEALPCVGYAESLVQAEITEFMKEAYDEEEDEREEIRSALQKGYDYFKLIRTAGNDARQLISVIFEDMMPQYQLYLEETPAICTDAAVAKFWEDTQMILDPSADYASLEKYMEKYSPGMCELLRLQRNEEMALQDRVLAEIAVCETLLRADATSQRFVLNGIREEITQDKDGYLRAKVQEKMR